jgi:acyl-CoA dehydrogenase
MNVRAVIPGQTNHTANQANAANWQEILEKIGPELERRGRDCDRMGTFVSANLNELQQHGFFALGVPAELGGGGLDFAGMCAMLRALGRWDGSTALTLSMHSHQVMVPEWKRRVMGAPTEGLLKRIAEEGVRLVSSGGSDWLPGSGRAEKVDGGYLITARKVFSSGSPDGHILMTSAVYNDPEKGPQVIHFPLSMKADGVKVMSNWDTLGMRGTGSNDVEIDNVFVPDSAIAATRDPDVWHFLFHVISMIAMPLVYSVYAGIADGIRQNALDLARKKKGDPALLMAVGEMENAYASLNLAHAALTACGNDKPSEETTNRVMTFRQLVGKAALEVATKALDVGSGAGFYRASGLELRFRDMQAARFHPLQDRTQQFYAARMALGMSVNG